MRYVAKSAERCEEVARYMVESGCTVRQAAKRFGISKSTVHKDVSQTLRRINYALWLNVCAILSKNKSERHLRGGEATRKKYEEIRNLTAECAYDQSSPKSNAAR